MTDLGHLSYSCKGCGLHYTEARCERFNEPHTVSDGTSTWIPAQPR